MSSPNNIIRASVDEVPSLAGAQLAFIGVGSNLATNLEEPSALLHRAFEALAGLSDLPVLVSSIWETSPVDCPPGSPRFSNAVVALRPRESDPMQLLNRLQQIEVEFGRTRTEQRNAPRTLDLDILSFGDVLMQEASLILPHPRMHERAFVLKPLLEIAPDYNIPGLKRPASALVQQIVGQGTLRPINFTKSL